MHADAYTCGDSLLYVYNLRRSSVCVCQVYYIDYGFAIETSMINLLELHKDFLSLPFQATNVRLAGMYNIGIFC